MLFHRRQDTEEALYPPGIVIVDIALNHPNQVSFAGKAPAIAAFPLQNTLEVLHGALSMHLPTWDIL